MSGIHKADGVARAEGLRAERASIGRRRAERRWGARAVTALLLPVLLALSVLGTVGTATVAAALPTAIPGPGKIGPVAGIGNGVSPGPAVAAALNGPGGVACVAGGNPCYITEANMHRVRMVDGGTITLFAGTGKKGYSGDGGPAASAQLSSPTGIAVDPAGNVYIADTGNAVVRKVGTDGTISTFAGGGSNSSGTAGAATSKQLSSPQGLAWHGGALYVNDFGLRRVWKVVGTTASSFAGGTTYGTCNGTATNTPLSTPSGIAFDSAGNAYIADAIAGVVCKVTPAGNVSVAAGTGPTPGFDGDDGPATQAKLFQPYDVAVRHTTVTTQEYVAPENPGDPLATADVQIGYDTLVIADTQNTRLRVVPLGATDPIPPTTGAGDPPAVGDLAGPAPANPDGEVGNIYTALGSSTRTRSGDGSPASVATTDDPHALFAAGSDVWFVESHGNTVRKITADADEALKAGTVSRYAGNGSASLAGDGSAATDANLAGPQNMTLGPDGDIYFADTNNQAIREIDTTTGKINTVAGNGSRTIANPDLGDGGPATDATLNFPSGVAVDADGNVYIADTGNNRIRKVDHATHKISTIAGNGTYGWNGDGPAVGRELAAPYAVAVAPDGSVVFADTFALRVRKISGGTVTTIAGSGGNVLGDGGAATNAALGLPVALAYDLIGNLYIATTGNDTSNSRVRMVAPNGVITTLAGGGNSLAEDVAATSANLTGMGGLTVDDYGEVFVADSARNRIRRVNPTGTITTIAGVTAGGYGGDGGDATAAKLLTPVGLAMGPQQSLLIADTGNSRVRAVGGVVSAQTNQTVKYVVAARHDFLSQAPTPRNIEQGVLQVGHDGKQAFVNGLANSPEWVNVIVTRFYQDTLGRAPDSGGLANWTNQIRSGALTVAQAASQFYSSLEYFQKPDDGAHMYGGGDVTHWVESLYSNLLHRTSDPGGLAAQVARTNREGRKPVAYSIYQSIESARDRVTDLYEERCGSGAEPACPPYRRLLNRAPDPSGMHTWPPIVLKQGDIALAASLASSKEYFNLAQGRTF